MSWLSKQFKSVKKIAKKVAPIGKYLPTPIGAGLSLLDASQKPGGVLKNLGSDFVQRAKFAAPMLAGGLGLGAAGGMGGGMAGGGGAAASMAGAAAKPGALDLAFKYGPDILSAGIAGYGAYQGAKQQKAGDKMQQRALDLAFKQYQDTEPLRARQRALLMQGPGARPDLTSVFRSQNNPFG